MSKAVSKTTHYLPKQGSYSIRLSRGGDIGEALPSEAEYPVYGEFKERADRARAELHEIEETLTRFNYKNPKLIARKRFLEAELNNIRGMAHWAYLGKYSHAFLAAARLMLPEELLTKIDNTIITQIGGPPRHWQRFLGENGFGKRDTSTYEKGPRG